MPENDERIEEYNTSRDLGPVMGFGGRLPLINPDGPRDFGIVRGLRRIGEWVSHLIPVRFRRYSSTHDIA